MPCILTSAASLCFSGFVNAQPFLKNSAEKSFSQQGLKRFRKHLGLKNFYKSHRCDFGDNPELIRFQTLKRQAFQVIVIFQFPEPGFDALSLMVKPVQLYRRKFKVTGNTIIISSYMPFTFFLRPIYSADNDNSRSDAAGKYDFFHVIQGDASACGNNCGRFLPGQFFKEGFPGSDNIKSRGSSDSVPWRKFR